MGKSYWAQNCALRSQRAREVIHAGAAGVAEDLMTDAGAVVVSDAMGDQAGVSDATIEGVVASEEAVDQVGVAVASVQAAVVATDTEVHRVVQDAISVVQGVAAVIVREALARGVVETDSVHVALKEDADSKLHIQIHRLISFYALLTNMLFTLLMNYFDKRNYSKLFNLTRETYEHKIVHRITI